MFGSGTLCFELKSCMQCVIETLSGLDFEGMHMCMNDNVLTKDHARLL